MTGKDHQPLFLKVRLRRLRVENWSQRIFHSRWKSGFYILIGSREFAKSEKTKTERTRD